MMDLFRVILCVVFANAFGAPIQDHGLDKRRESTPEILGLEQELKKAAGENKQYFSNPNARPMPQIDGLDISNEELQKSVAKENNIPDKVDVDEPHQNPAVHIGDHDDDGGMTLPDEDDLDNENEVPPQDDDSYMEMLKLFKEHPEYMEAMYQDYLTNPEDGMGDMNEIEPSNVDENPEYENVKRAGDIGVFAYPNENELLLHGAPFQSKDYVPSDEQDREAALMADYAAASNSRYPFTLPSQEDLYDEEEGDDNDGEATNENDESKGEANINGDDDVDEVEEDEEELNSLENNQMDTNQSRDTEVKEDSNGSNMEPKIDMNSNESWLAAHGKVPPAM